MVNNTSDISIFSIIGGNQTTTWLLNGVALKGQSRPSARGDRYQTNQGAQLRINNLTPVDTGHYR